MRPACSRLPRAHPSNWFATKPLGEIDMGELLHLLVSVASARSVRVTRPLTQ